MKRSRFPNTNFEFNPKPIVKPARRTRRRSKRRFATITRKRKRLNRKPMESKSLMNLVYTTKDIPELKVIMKDMLFLRRVGDIDLDAIIPEEVLRSKINIDIEIPKYDLSEGIIHYTIYFKSIDNTDSHDFVFKVEKILDPTEQRVNYNFPFFLFVNKR